MAEYIMKDLVRRAGAENQISIHCARRLTAQDYSAYDLFIGMDKANMRNMCRILGGDPEGKVHLLLDYAGRPGQEVADPWYTGDFETTYRDVLEGCRGLLDQLL